MSYVMLLKPKDRQDLFRVCLGRKGNGLVLFRNTMYFFGHRVHRVFVVSVSTERWNSKPLKRMREVLLRHDLIERVSKRPCMENLPL